MPIKKKIPLSNIPVKLALVIILVFGLVPGIGFTVYKYQSMTDQLTLAETEFMKSLKTELRGDVDAAISLFTYQREISEHRLKRSIKAAVENAHNMMSQLYDLQKDRMSGPDLAVLLKKSVGAIRLFNGRGNLFILSAQGRDISLPLSSGPQAAALEKQAATQKVLEMAQTQGEGFFRYAWPHPDGFGRTLEKIAYVMRFIPMNWVVGAADYPGGIETSIQQEMVDTFLQFNLDQKITSFIMDRQMRLITDIRYPGLPHEYPELEFKRAPDLAAALGSIPRNTLASDGQYGWYDSGREGRETKPMFFFARYYAPWGWTVGIQADMDRLMQQSATEHQNIRQALFREYTTIFAAIGLAILFIYAMGKNYARQLRKNLGEFDAFFHQAGHANERIDLDQVRFTELFALARTANTMIAERERTDARVKQANAELRQANQRLKEMANQDGLTGVANRRFFDQSMAKEWARAIREKTPVAIGMVDIDRFKQFNDTYGHQKGDHCLRQVAHALKKGVRRPADLVARYGGEEFVVLLPGTDLAGMDRVARKMQANVADLEIPHVASPTGRVSFSMGIAVQVPDTDTPPESLIALADKALYQAKTNGRNQICGTG